MLFRTAALNCNPPYGPFPLPGAIDDVALGVAVVGLVTVCSPEEMVVVRVSIVVVEVIVVVVILVGSAAAATVANSAMSRQSSRNKACCAARAQVEVKRCIVLVVSPDLPRYLCVRGMLVEIARMLRSTHILRIVKVAQTKRVERDDALR